MGGFPLAQGGLDRPLEPRERGHEVAVGRGPCSTLVIPGLEKLRELVRQALGPRVARLVLVEDPLLPGLDRLAQGSHGLEKNAVVDLAASRAEGGDADEGEEHEAALRLGEALEEGHHAPRVAVAVRGAALPRPDVRPVEEGAVGGAVDLDPARRPAALRADGLALRGAGALAPPLPAEGELIRS